MNELREDAISQDDDSFGDRHSSNADLPCFTHTTGHYLQCDDAQVYFEIAGNPDGQPLVLLHGGLGSLADFNPILGRLPSEFRFIGIDFRGHGKSTMGSARLTYAQYQADVEAVLAHLGLDEVSILGFSDGGIVGYRMAANAPSAIRKLMTIGAQWRLTAADPAFEMLSGLTSAIWAEMFPASIAYYNRVNPAPDFEALVKAAVGLWLDLESTGYPSDAVQRITAPLLIVRGDEDFLFSLNEAAALRERVNGASFFNLPFAGHAAHEDSPEMFCAGVNAFLARPVADDRTP